ncbi:hypothetical protein MNB_SUP05-13-246 [hydrothermal vent metagenome]|uniref:Uncharacterized protein n=1 Tax=hydrothermal vent metagenome TaxID=652676 RepID=A0A1W1DJ17_9ZZZZ
MALLLNALVPIVRHQKLVQFLVGSFKISFDSNVLGRQSP